MAESMSKEVYFLNQVANQKYNKDFAVNMVQVNNTLKSISKYLIVMQKGIDDLNRDILEVVRDMIKEIIIIFNGGDFSSLDFEWGDVKYIFRAIGQFFGFPLWSGSGNQWNPVQMVEYFVKNFLDSLISVVSSFFTGGGLFNLGQLTGEPINLISYDGQFSSLETVKDGEGWFWDQSEGRTDPGSARFDAVGRLGGVLTPPTPARVEPGKQYTPSAWVKWAGANVGASVKIYVTWYGSNRKEISSTDADSFSISSLGGWTELKAELSAPVGAYWAAVFVSVGEGTNSGSVWWDDIGLYSKSQSLPQAMIAGLVDAISDLWGGVGDAVDWVRKFISNLIGRPVGAIEDAVQDALTWVSQLGGILSGGNPLEVLPSLAGHAVGTIQTMVNQFASIAAGDFVTPINNVVQNFKDGWGGLQGGIVGAAQDAVNSVIDGMNGIGQFANSIAAAIRAAINEIIGSIFGDGGTKWGQEVLVASGPVTTGPNDIPLGFGMPFSGKITDLAFYSSEHLAVGQGSQVAIDMRRNGTTIYSTSWTGGTASKTVGGLNISVTKLDRITFWVTGITSQMANMSVSVVGKYV